MNTDSNGWQSKSVRTSIKNFTPVLDCMVDNPELGVMGALVYGVILRHCWMSKGACRASHETLASKLGIDVRTVRTYIPKLIELEYITDLTPDLRNKPHTYIDTGKAGLEIEVRGFDNYGRTESPTEKYPRLIYDQPEQVSTLIYDQPQADLRSAEETKETVNVNLINIPNFSNSEGAHDVVEEEYFPPDYPYLETATAQPTLIPAESPKPDKNHRGHELWGIAHALADVCKMDFGANEGRLKKEAKWLSNAESIAPTPALVREYFGEGSWYYRSDWRGQKGLPPRPELVRQLWGKWECSADPIMVDPRSMATEVYR